MTDLLKVLAPLLQTLLWVGLIGGIVWRYHDIIHDILTAVKKRIDSGSNIKAGPIEISEQLRPQDSEQQREKIHLEIKELKTSKVNITEEPIKNQSALQARYFQAEDLAMRAIQSKFGVSISRQVTAGKDLGFDGVFTLNGTLNIVEIKYTHHKPSVSNYRKSIEQIHTAISKYNWKNVRIIFAIVVEHPKDKEISDIEMERIGLNCPFPMEIFMYDIESLEKEFGIEK